MRKIPAFLAVFMLLLGAVWGWRLLHPNLTDEQKIAAALDDLAASANARSARGIAAHLAKEFRFGSTRKKELQDMLVGGFLQCRVVDLQFSGVKTVVQGATATSSGRYNLSLKAEYNSPPDAFSDPFRVQWRQSEDGEWLIANLQAEPPAAFRP